MQRRVFATKINISDDKINAELVVERTIVAGTRISLVGEVKHGEGRRRWIEVVSDYIRGPHNFEHEVKHDGFR